MNKYILVKGDISGIQEFIFNVQSKGAAKALKKRSLYIEKVSSWVEELIRQHFPICETIYNGGGNLYIKITDAVNWQPGQLKEIQRKVSEALHTSGLTCCLAYIECIQPDVLYGNYLQELNRAAAKAKLSGFSDIGDSLLFFNPFNLNGSQHNNNPMHFDKDNNNLGQRTNIPIWTRELKDQYQEVINERRKNDPLLEMPDVGDTIEFGYLADFAKERTGTDKLGILKLDVDNLGSLFQKVRSEKDNRDLSNQLSDFFSKETGMLLTRQFFSKRRVREKDSYVLLTEGGAYKKQGKFGWETNNVELSTFKVTSLPYWFKDNIYVVFSGGDDCFLIGAWDAVIAFTLLLNNEFEAFQQRLRNKLPDLRGDAPITLSAAIILVDDHHPVVKFAELVEEALFEAKTTRPGGNKKDAAGKPLKGKISFLGKVFTWNEFQELTGVKDILYDMIAKYGEKRAFLQRIMNAFENTDSDYWEHTGKSFEPAILWRFLYHFRDMRDKEYFKANFYNYFFGNPEVERLGGLYKKHVADTFANHEKLSPILPVAARWTDFLTRNI
jgi:CRISPR-associated protein Csm1